MVEPSRGIVSEPPREATPSPCERTTDGSDSARATTNERGAVRLLLAISLFFLLLGAWSWTNRVEFVAPLGDGTLYSDDLAELRTVDVGPVLPMTSADEWHWVLSYGFDTPEPDGTWIVALRSRIIFEADGDAPRQLVLNLYPFLVGEVSSREIEVRSSAGAVSRTLVDGVNGVSVPLDGDARQVVEITCSRVDSPLDLGVGADERTLCAKLLDIRILGN